MSDWPGFTREWAIQPSDGGLTTWTGDPASATAAAAMTAGTLLVARVPVRATTTFANASVITTTAGTGATALANCYLGLYDITGVLRGKTADQATAWAATAGFKSDALIAESGQNLTINAADRWAYIGFLIGTQSTTAVQHARTTGTAAIPNLAQTGSTTPPARFMQKASFGSALTSPLTFSAFSLNGGFWAGLS